MTVYELIEELRKHPPLDEVKIIFGDLTISIERIGHAAVNGEHVVLID